MSRCAPLPLQAVTITRLGNEAALIRLTGAPPIRELWDRSRIRPLRTGRLASRHRDLFIIKCGHLDTGQRLPRFHAGFGSVNT